MERDPALPVYTGSGGNGIAMPICFKPESLHGKEDARDKDQAESSAPDWREPPGYLGEAVRRAKRISGKCQPKPPGNHPKD